MHAYAVALLTVFQGLGAPLSISAAFGGFSCGQVVGATGYGDHGASGYYAVA